MYARAGATPPLTVTFLEKVGRAPGIVVELRHADAADRAAGARDAAARS